MSKFSQSTIARLGYLVLKTPEHNLVTSLNWAGSQHFSRLRPFCPGSIMDQFDVTASIDWLLAIIPCSLSPWCPGLHYSAHSGPWPLTEVSGVSSQSRPVPSLRPGQVSQQNTTGSKMPALRSTGQHTRVLRGNRFLVSAGPGRPGHGRESDSQSRFDLF